MRLSLVPDTCEYVDVKINPAVPPDALPLGQRLLWAKLKQKLIYSSVIIKLIEKKEYILFCWLSKAQIQSIQLFIFHSNLIKFQSLSKIKLYKISLYLHLLKFTMMYRIFFLLFWFEHNDEGCCIKFSTCYAYPI